MSEAQETRWDSPEDQAEEALILRPTPGDIAQEGRANAVSAMLAEAYKNTSGIKLLPEESKALREPFADDQVSDGAQGKAGLLYVQHIHLSDRLNDVLGIGQWAIVRRSQWPDEKAGKVYVDAVLLIRGAVAADAIGAARYTPTNRMTDYSDAVESGLSDALSRCCKRLGIGSQVWDKAFCAGWLKRREAEAKKAQKASKAPKAPEAEDETQETSRDAKYLAAITVEKNRVGEEAFNQIIGLVFGVEKPEGIIGWDQRRKFYDSLKALPAKALAKEA